MTIYKAFFFFNVILRYLAKYYGIARVSFVILKSHCMQCVYSTSILNSCTFSQVYKYFPKLNCKHMVYFEVKLLNVLPLSKVNKSGDEVMVLCLLPMSNVKKNSVEWAYFVNSKHKDC